MGMILTLGQLHSTDLQFMMPTFLGLIPVLDWLGYWCVLIDVIMAVGWAPLAVPPTAAVKVSRALVCLFFTEW